MDIEVAKKLKSTLSKLAQQLSATSTIDLEVYIYDDKSCDQVFIDYENIKDEIKLIITDDNFLSDRHKIAAFFIDAIVKNRPIKIKLNETDISDIDLEIVVNINLALSFANYILKSFYKKQNNKVLKISLPKGNQDNYAEQLSTLIKLIRDSIDSTNNSILLLSISHILFLIEKYSECKGQK